MDLPCQRFFEVGLEECFVGYWDGQVGASEERPKSGMIATCWVNSGTYVSILTSREGTENCLSSKGDKIYTSSKTALCSLNSVSLTRTEEETWGEFQIRTSTL